MDRKFCDQTNAEILEGQVYYTIMPMVMGNRPTEEEQAKLNVAHPKLQKLSFGSVRDMIEYGKQHLTDI